MDIELSQYKQIFALSRALEDCFGGSGLGSGFEGEDGKEMITSRWSDCQDLAYHLFSESLSHPELLNA